MENQFYLTLPSNSSMSYYPDNTTTKFSTHLTQQLRLNGAWEVAVVEFHYPCTYTTTGGNNPIELYAYTDTKEDLWGIYSSSSDYTKVRRSVPDGVEVPGAKETLRS